MRPALRLVALGMAALGMAACGIPTSNSARSVPDHQVPFHLLSPTIPSTTTTSRPAAAFVSEPIYAARGSQVVEVRRDVVVPAGLTDVLEALFAGPTAAETSQGLTSAIPTTVKVLATTTQGGRVTLDLSRDFGQITGPAEVTAIAQIVLTATRQPGVEQVLFSIVGHPISVPTPNGVTTSQPVGAADYRSLVLP